MKQKIKENIKRTLPIISIIIPAIILIAGITYAYFVVDIKNSETTTTLIGESGDMTIYYDDGPHIAVGQLIPSNTPFTTKNFTITGNTKLNVTMNYNITLKKDSNDFTDYSLAYKLTSTNTNSNGTVVPSSPNDMCYMLTGTNDEVLGTGSFTGPTSGNKVHSYSLKLYFPEDSDLSENVGKKFSFYINVEEGIKPQSKCRPIPTIENVILADNGGASNITEAPTSLFSEISTETENKVYKMEDDYGTSYYFRGAKSYVNNNLIFANHQWKILRINGDGSVRIIYNGECPGNSCAINSVGVLTNMMLPSDLVVMPPNSGGQIVFNLMENDNKYVGYMYGGSLGTESTSKAIANLNQTDSTVKQYLDIWYESNIKHTQYENYISDTLFCNDRNIIGLNGGGYSAMDTLYAASTRLFNNIHPSLKCELQNDRFTTLTYNNSSVPGNNALQYPIGLITADEASVAGLKFFSTNNENFLSSEESYWTISPEEFLTTWTGGAWSFNWMINQSGQLAANNSTTEIYVRGVLNLKPNTKVTGSGTSLDPYVVL